MGHEDKLREYLSENLITATVEDGFCEIGDKIYDIVKEDEKIFDEDFEFLPKITEDGAIYNFGGRWYLQTSKEDVDFDELLYVGKANQKLETNIFIGVHSGNELLNGVGMYSEWIKKAKFLGVKSLGICETNSLAGVIDFQEQCKKNDIKPIIGMSITVTGKRKEKYSVKAYVKSFLGWQNILKFNKELNLNQKQAIDEDFLISNSDGLFFIVDPKETVFGTASNKIIYYQLDTVVFDNEDIDAEYANNLEKYLKSDLRPVLLTDAFYINKRDWEFREMLWKIGKTFYKKSKNQYFKNDDQIAKEIISLFDNGNSSWIRLYKEAKKNLTKIASGCNFTYSTGNRMMPEYIMTEEESKKHKTKDDLFLSFIKDGFKKRNIKDTTKYISRLKKEIDVLKKGHVIDYFLILHDIIKAMRKEDVLIGIGRGSAGGSIVSYLLGIIQIDPIEFNLLFERFLNDGRMGSIEPCPAFEIETDDGTLTMNEGSVVRINRNGKEFFVFAEDLVDGDFIIDFKMA